MSSRVSLDTVCAALAYAMGIEAPENAASPSEALCHYIDSALVGRRAARVFMYNPDAIAEWIYHKHAELFSCLVSEDMLELPLATVMPSVTPVCFGTMYTGAQPSVHGIRSYTKPVIAIDTLFDAMIRAGKRPAIISTSGDSMSKIYLDRDMDYFFYDTIDEVNAKAAELIAADGHDFIAVYNGNYDSAMHKTGTESEQAIEALRANVKAFCDFRTLIDDAWGAHDALIGFAMDHGCHDIDGGCGSHGLDMDEDIDIVHLYLARPAKN